MAVEGKRADVDVDTPKEDAGASRAPWLVAERERIAMELHDGVVQSLLAVGMSLHAAMDDPQELRRRLDDALANLDDTIVDLRHYIFDLHVDHGSLPVVLLDMARSFARCGVDVTLQTDPDAVDALAAFREDVIQVAREALSNAVRHSGSPRIQLSIRRELGAVVLEVADEGTGLVEYARGGGGIGNLHARAARVGAALQVHATPGRGTIVRFLVPA